MFFGAESWEATCGCLAIALQLKIGMRRETEHAIRLADPASHELQLGHNPCSSEDASGFGLRRVAKPMIRLADPGGDELQLQQPRVAHRCRIFRL